MSAAPMLALLLFLASTSAPAPSYWLAPVPGGEAEQALADTIAQASFVDAARASVLLDSVATRYPGTPSAGLARLAAAWRLIDDGKPADALPLLQRPEVEAAHLPEQARLLAARALDAAGDSKAAAAAYQALAERPTAGVTACAALFAGAEASAKAGEAARAVALLSRSLELCPSQQPRALLRASELEASRASAAALLDRLDADFPASPQARESAVRRRLLAPLLPARPAAERTARDLRKALALAEASRHLEAVPLLRDLSVKPTLTAEERGQVQIQLARSLTGLRRGREAAVVLARVVPERAAEAAFLQAQSTPASLRVAALELVARNHAGTPWGEEALVTLANNQQKDGRLDEAVPFYRRLLAEYPDGRYLERATWRVGYWDFRHGNHLQAAELLERVARRRPTAFGTPAFLFWAGRARRELGQAAEARVLFDETVTRFKNSYYGVLAEQWLARTPGPRPSPVPLMVATPSTEGLDEAALLRVRELLLIGRLDEALEELQRLPSQPVVQATMAWIEARRGRLRPALTAMKRAFPEYVGQAGDALPEPVRQILYPLQYRDTLLKEAGEKSLDPALVAALVCQESTFDAGAVSGAGARGLMQIMPQTGRLLARQVGVTLRRDSLHQPQTSLELGTRYLRDLLDRFDGKVERALAAYNAGPHRVDAWTAAEPGMSAEDFVENIPFTETRFYVMTILGNREQYSRLYALAAASGGGGQVAGR